MIRQKTIIISILIYILVNLIDLEFVFRDIDSKDHLRNGLLAG